jgi:hypothetical protein
MASFHGLRISRSVVSVVIADMPGFGGRPAILFIKSVTICDICGLTVNPSNFYSQMSQINIDKNLFFRRLGDQNSDICTVGTRNLVWSSDLRGGSRPKRLIAKAKR